ncbi:hypothetical protein KSP40_PGU010692 [Platanthera guangdongensis]|uniref:Cytochrome b6-f complex iron-sulfur subunit-like transmembrane anchor domain-containing protein n=1 Tax=Platanthera guangdongensis TaxID=2320717 RepID=A0ABR2LXK3_9ASPA
MAHYFHNFTEGVILSSRLNDLRRSPTTASCHSQLCSSRNGIFAPSYAGFCKPAKGLVMEKDRRMRIACQATSISADRVPDMEKRKLMNLILLGAISLPSAGMLIPYTYLFVPPGTLATYGINAVCTHLGCVVPWNSAEKKFICPLPWISI